jgi:hypothetical protein
MAGGSNRSGTKHSRYYNMPKRRCCIEGCKKRAKYIIKGKPYCKHHRK